MNEYDLKKQLDRSADHAPDAEAKQRAIAMAVSEFKSQQAHSAAQEHRTPEKNSYIPQGFWRWLRLTISSNKTNRRDPMNTPNFAQKKWLLGGIATACMAVFGIMIGTEQTPFMPLHPLNDTGQMPPPPAQAQEDVIVTGMRTSLETAADIRRESSAVVEAISAEDIALLHESDAAAAESLQRVAGIAIVEREKRQQLTSPAPAKPRAMMSPPGRDIAVQQIPSEGRDRFEHVETNAIKLTREEPVSTFSIDVDTASYSFVRRQLNRGVLPQKDAVRLEEMVNYFDYQYPQPTSTAEPFSRNITVITSPWNIKNKLVHIGIKGYELSAEQPKSNVVFLLDVSGSMNAPDKLPLVKQSMNLLLSKLRPDDTVAIAVYAGAAGTVLAPTKVAEKQTILEAINTLQAGGSTAGAEGIKLAYQLAESSFREDAVNRIFLATDGDFNVGIQSNEELKGFVERKREKGIYLSVLGFGGGNYNDALMQQLAQNGNGVAAYIDTLSEAQKVLVTEATANLFPIAKDVKIQVEFNPATVAEYRLLGYETRALKREDFNNDAVDAGEIGAGHTVTALYEITPVNSGAELIDTSRYSETPIAAGHANEYGFVKIRYKQPDADNSQLLTTTINMEARQPSALMLREARFATAVAGFAQLLKNGQYTGEWGFDDAIVLAQANKGDDEYGYRTEYIQLIRKAKMARAL